MDLASKAKAQTAPTREARAWARVRAGRALAWAGRAWAGLEWIDSAWDGALLDRKGTKAGGLTVDHRAAPIEARRADGALARRGAWDRDRASAGRVLADRAMAEAIEAPARAGTGVGGVDRIERTVPGMNGANGVMPRPATAMTEPHNCARGERVGSATCRPDVFACCYAGLPWRPSSQGEGAAFRREVCRLVGSPSARATSNRAPPESRCSSWRRPTLARSVTLSSV